MRNFRTSLTPGKGRTLLSPEEPEPEKVPEETPPPPPEDEEEK